MIASRRKLIKAGVAAGVAAGLSTPLRLSRAQSSTVPWPAQAFAEQPLAVTMEQLFADEPISPSDRISIEMVDLAEDGAIIPIRITTTLPEIRTITILAEKNPVPLVASFELNPMLEPPLAARVKMAESAHIIVVVTAAGGHYSAKRYIQVATGGCS